MIFLKIEVFTKTAKKQFYFSVVYSGFFQKKVV